MVFFQKNLIWKFAVCTVALLAMMRFFGLGGGATAPEVDVPQPDEPHRAGREVPALDDAALASLVSEVARGEAAKRQPLRSALAARAATMARQAPAQAAVYADPGAVRGMRLFSLHAVARAPAIIRGTCDAGPVAGTAEPEGPPNLSSQPLPRVPAFAANNFAARLSRGAARALLAMWSDPKARFGDAPVSATAGQPAHGWVSLQVSAQTAGQPIRLRAAALGAHSVVLLRAAGAPSGASAKFAAQDDNGGGGHTTTATWVPLEPGDAIFVPGGSSLDLQSKSAGTIFEILTYVDASNWLEFSAWLALADDADGIDAGIADAKREVFGGLVERVMHWPEN
jgi:hypothetical protein